MFSIYRVTNIINHKSYIGFTTRTAKERFREHCEPGSKKNLPFANAIRKNGRQSFVLDILEMGENEEYGRNIAEPMYIAWLRPEYNVAPGGGGARLFGPHNGFYGRHHSDATKQILREKCSGRTPTPDEKARQSAAQSGKPHPCIRVKIRSDKGVARSEEQKTKLRGRVPWNKGKTGVQVAWNKGLRGEPI